MLRRALLAAVLLALLVPAVLAAEPSKGPFAGVVGEGQSREHPYTNHPNPNVACPVYPWGSTRPYVLVLTYEPPTDRVDLWFKGSRATGQNGVAKLELWGPNCLSGSVYALGVSVTAPYAAYEIVVLDAAPTPTLEDLVGPA